MRLGVEMLTFFLARALTLIAQIEFHWSATDE